MKSKGEKIALFVAIAIVICVILAIVGGTIFLVKHIKITKKAITSEKFISVMKDEGFEVKEQSDIYGIKAGKIYKADNGKYSVEYYSFDNVSDADSFFDSVQKQLVTKSASKEVSLSGRNYRAYTVVKSGAYYFVERVENTVVIVQGSSSHEKISKDLLKKFGY